jgi:Lrp/AsnC family leucine-responsive transcriptional regulator
MELDSIDLAILTALQTDGRMSNAALAEKVGLSPSACSRRLDNLEKSGTSAAITPAYPTRRSAIH